MGITRACGLVGISRSLFAYESKRTGDVALTERMKGMAARKRRYGYRRIHILLRREGWQTNHNFCYPGIPPITFPLRKINAL